MVTSANSHSGSYWGKFVIPHPKSDELSSDFGPRPKIVVLRAKIPVCEAAQSIDYVADLNTCWMSFKIADHSVVVVRTNIQNPPHQRTWALVKYAFCMQRAIVDAVYSYIILYPKCTQYTWSHFLC